MFPLEGGAVGAGRGAAAPPPLLLPPLLCAAASPAGGPIVQQSSNRTQHTDFATAYLNLASSTELKKFCIRGWP
jgi:hypothetical protein